MGQISKMFGGGSGGGGFGSIANMISGGGGQRGMMPGGPQGMFPPGPGGAGGAGGFGQMFDKLNIQNLLPAKQGGPNESIFDMVDNDTFVRKIKKSNYADIVSRL